MTIITYRDGLIAADTLVVVTPGEFHGHRVGHGPKLHRLADGVLAYVGAAPASRAVHNWIASGRDGDLPPLKEGGCIWFPDSGVIEDINEEGVTPLDFEAPYLAWGCGESYALAAMWAGADAAKAVEAAIALSLYCGGDVQTMRRGG